MAFLLHAGFSHAVPIDSTGTLHGIVVFRSDGSPGAYANIIVVGTRRGTQSGPLGDFRIEGVPVGSRIVRTLLSGAEWRSDTVTVRRGVSTELLIELEGTPPPPPIRIGSRSALTDEDFEVLIRPVRRFHVGDQAEFEVRIRSRGSTAALLVRSVEGSDRGRAPAAWIGIVGPPEGWSRWGRMFGGASRGVEPADFVEIRPGEIFDPFTGRSLEAGADMGTFKRPGRYTATFRYMTLNTTPGSWAPPECERCDVSTEVRRLLERVPVLDLIALTTFDVEP
jgi:hypothetical protein